MLMMQNYSKEANTVKDTETEVDTR
jgi:hypothetical protein